MKAIEYLRVMQCRLGFAVIELGLCFVLASKVEEERQQALSV